MSIDIHGTVAPGFERVRDAFAANFAENLELGARFAFSVEGEIVVDLWAGWADRKQTIPFDEKTLTLIFSTTKAVAATMIGRLVEAGKLRYDQPVAELWPEFAANGKDAITVEQVLSHQAGLPGFVEQIDPTLWYDPATIVAMLAAKAPMWTPGMASGYHALTVGYLVGEIYRRADGRSLGTALREEITGPAGLDLWIGLPDSEHDRVSVLKPPSGYASFGGEPNDPQRAAFLSPWAGPSGRAGGDWRRIEVPSANGHATAEALARFFGALATDGDIDGVHVLSPAIVAEASRERIRNRDLVLPFEMSWAAGFMRNEPNAFFGPTKTTIGHTGFGGSCAFADRERRVAGAYVMNKQDVHLAGDPRPVRLIGAAYASL